MTCVLRPEIVMGGEKEQVYSKLQHDDQRLAGRDPRSVRSGEN
jgi:hypothetical protein